MDSFEIKEVAGNIGLFPIMRAGLGMVDGNQLSFTSLHNIILNLKHHLACLEMIPVARTYHLGLYRESSTLLPVEYYNKLPSQCEINTGFVLDPMVNLGSWIRIRWL